MEVEAVPKLVFLRWRRDTQASNCQVVEVPFTKGICCMKCFPLFLSLVAVLVGASIFGVPSQACAQFQLIISSADAGAITTITDNQSGDTNNSEGVIQFSGQVGPNFSIVVTASTMTALGSATNPIIDLTFAITKLTGTADTLTLRAGDFNFGPPTTPSGNMVLPMSVTSGTLTSGVTVTNFATLDNQNNSNNRGVTSQSATSTFTTTSFSGTSTLPFSGSSNFTGDYALAEVITSTGSASGDARLGALPPAPTPAPAGLVLALTAMPILGLGRWLRRRQRTTLA
jgi:hypothetical protein